jgi:hypothetical protein
MMGLGFQVLGSGGSTCLTFAEIEKFEVECCLLVCVMSAIASTCAVSV